MARLALSIGGAVVGGIVGGPIGAAVGASIGGAVGGYIDNNYLFPSKGITNSGPRLTDLSVQVSTYGNPINIVYGSARIAGNVIWAQEIKEVTTTTTQSSGGKGGVGGGVQSTTTTYSYFITMAVGICAGEIGGIINTWADSELLTDEFLQTAGNNFTVYLGSEDQLPDPIMESFDGAGNVPAYRGLAYVVMKDFPLQNFGNRIPNFTFEVQKPVVHTPALEDKITAITIIPGAGETVYDTVVESKIAATTQKNLGFTNMQTGLGTANVLLALDQLKKTLPNIQWVSLVVNWFGSSLDAGTCIIEPRVEYPDTAEDSPNAWSVGTFDRSNTPVVMHFPDGSPTFGGTPSDGSIIRLCQELKNRGYNVMFYPLLQMDIISPAKPWRGMLTPANATDAAQWFTKTNGYNAFISHYYNLAALTANIDAFVIGSEFVGMTSATFSSGVYPAVTGFSNLATAAKSALGGSIKTVYAADWSEYHSAAGGWFNLDPLWSNSSLDLVGIDGYFPLTPDLPQSQISEDDVYAGWTKNEGWDYFYDNRPNNLPGTSNLTNNPITTISGQNIVTLDLTGFFDAHLLIGEVFTLAGLTGPVGGISAANLNGIRSVLNVIDGTHITFVAGATASGNATGAGSAGTINKPKYFNGFTYAWKNVSYWWSHTHVNPDSSTTSWTPKLKPIWFTEFGFPSVDACSNQPNVFVDPNSVNSSYPRASKQQVDFHAQREALDATENFLTDQNAISGNSDLIPVRFVWTYDARPYPYWPNLLNVWSDGAQWKTGHWVNGKLGQSDLGAIVADILDTIGISSYDISLLNGIPVDGYVISNITSGRDAIQTLTTPYFFDMVESDGVLKFIPRGQNSVVTIPQDELIPLTGGQNQSGSNSILRIAAQIVRAQETELPQKITVTYMNQANQYQANTQIIQRQVTDSINQVNYSWPLVISDQDAANMCQRLVYSAWIARTTYQFTLPPKYAYLEATDVCTITLDNVDHNVRILNCNVYGNGKQEVNAIAEDISVYDQYVQPGNGPTSQQLPLVIPDIQLDLLDLPAFPGDAITDDFLTYAAVALGHNWRGTVVYRSDDGGETGGNIFNIITSIGTQASIGIVTGTIPAAASHTWDYGTVVEVTMTNGTLSSITELGVLNGGNAFAAGGEVIQFQNAELVDTNVYHLTKLLRGRLGTEDFIATHIANEDFVLLDSTVVRLPMAYNLIQSNRFYKAVPLGGTLDNTDEQEFNYTARQLMPFSPVLIFGTRNVGLDLTINWTRRTRIGGELRDGVDVPLSEASEAYQVDIYNGMTVVRTISSIIETCIYTAAQQIADFGSTQSSVTIKVYQMSQLIGRGIPGNATV